MGLILYARLSCILPLTPGRIVSPAFWQVEAGIEPGLRGCRSPSMHTRLSLTNLLFHTFHVCLSFLAPQQALYVFNGRRAVVTPVYQEAVFMRFNKITNATPLTVRNFWFLGKLSFRLSW